MLPATLLTTAVAVVFTMTIPLALADEGDDGPKKCELGTLSAQLKDVEKHCCKGNDCSQTGFPGHHGTCSLECAEVLEPFFDSCNPVLSALRMMPAEMPRFFDKCMAVMYAPGRCRVIHKGQDNECTGKVLKCKMKEVKSACCSAQSNCPPGKPTPRSCAVGCAMVYPAFLKQCGAQLKKSVNADKKLKAQTKKEYIAQYDKFSAKCKRQHAPGVVEFASTLVEQGCKIDLPKVKQHNGHDFRPATIKPSKVQTGASTPWGSAQAAIDGDCTTLHSMMIRLHEAREQCCMSDDDCQNGFPSVCHPGCAIAFHGMFKKCGVILNTFVPAKILATYARFDGLCTSENYVDIEGFLDAIAHAECELATLPSLFCLDVPTPCQLPRST